MQEHFEVVKKDEKAVGITPACAGTFKIEPIKRKTDGDHPCVCRNIFKDLTHFSKCLGSPLRVQEH